MTIVAASRGVGWDGSDLRCLTRRKLDQLPEVPVESQDGGWQAVGKAGKQVKLQLAAAFVKSPHMQH